jgi:alpha-beta hydrolase superfamily lysophospholipase
MMSPSEGTMTGKTRLLDIEVRSTGGLALRGRWWRREAPRAVLVVAHGYGEHGGCYRRVAESVAERADLDVIAVDFRGHGRSPGRRGVVRNYDELTDDLLQTLEWAARQRPGLHSFVLGHSNGGQVTLRACLRNPAGIAGAIVSNPVLRVSVQVPPVKMKVARFLARHAPWVTLKGSLNAELLTRDPEIQQEHRTDPLRHSRMSAPLFFGMIEGGAMLMERAGEITTPILMLLGGQDTITDPAAARTFFDRIGGEDKTLTIYPKMLHEPLNEVGRGQVLDDVLRWLEPRL